MLSRLLTFPRCAFHSAVENNHKYTQAFLAAHHAQVFHVSYLFADITPQDELVMTDRHLEGYLIQTHFERSQLTD